MKWYQSLARWALLGGVIGIGIATLANGLGERPGAGRRRAIVDNDAKTHRRLAAPVADSSDVNRPGNASRSDDDWQTVVRQIDDDFRKHWEQSDLQPAPEADWLTVGRRLSLALVGSGLSLEEIRQWEQVPLPQRDEMLLESLLADERFANYWAERLARAYVGVDQGQLVVFRRRRFVKWLAEQIRAQVPYPTIVRQMISARGLWTENPQVNFLTVTLDQDDRDGRPDPIRLAARTSRAFLGMRIDCLQCHDDMLGNVLLGSDDEPRPGTQQDFHQLAAFYSPAINSWRGIRDDKHEYEYRYLDDQQEQTVAARVPFLNELIPDDDPASPTRRRQRLADWVTHRQNMPAARAVVNRVWAMMFGKPLSSPVDDISLHGPFPVGMERLAQDYAHHGGSLQRLIRIIAHLDVYRRSSRCDFEITPAHEDAWAVMPLVRLRSEQVARSIVQASRLAKIDGEATLFTQLQTLGDQSDFIRRYGDSGEDEFNHDAVTVTQRLLLMNGKMVHERITKNPIVNASTHVAMFAADDAQAIEIVYLAVLNRRPDAAETEALLVQASCTPHRAQFVEDLYWMLINGSEFSWNH